MVSYDCACDYDPPEFYSCVVRRARKTHKCVECSGPIIPGDNYEYVSGKWEGYFDAFSTCEACVDLRTWVKNNVPCFCWAYGNADEEMGYAIDDAYDRARDEVIGLRFGFLRRKVLRAQRNDAARAAV